MTRAVVIGAGHNGLTAACYLAKAGVSVTVLEQRDVVGGAAVTEELIPGFSVSAASYSLSLLRPDVFEDLELARHGLEFYPKDPQLFVPMLDGRHMFIWRDAARTREEISRIHGPDADGYARFNAFWDEAVRVLRPMVESESPPTLVEIEKELARRGKEEIFRLAVASSAATCVSEFFGSEELRGAFVSQGIIGTDLSPMDDGTAWVMAYHFMGGELNGADGTWAYVRGGMGGLTTAMRRCAEELSVRILCSRKVDEISISSSKVQGVVAGGETFEADMVLSNAHPVTTFSLCPASHPLPDEVSAKLASWRSPGSVVKVNLAVAELPSFTSLPGTEVGPQHLGTWELSPSIEYVDAAFRDSRDGVYSQHPFMEVFIQSASDDSLAPAGKHVVSAFTQYAPRGVDAESFDGMREAILSSVIETMSAYAPNIADAVIASDVLGPHDLERRFGLVGGNIFHGEITPDQSFGDRFSYRTGIPGLYLCGSGASPGGGVMAAAGRNCARVALSDL